MKRTPALGNLGDQQIKQLGIFKTVVDCGGFAAAETTLNIGRSAISMHITTLESRLNLVLCRRGRGGFALTREGAVIYEKTCELLDSLDGFRQMVNNLSQQLSGQLRLGLSDHIALDARSQLPELFKDFASQAPEVEINTSMASMAELELNVLNGQVDIGLIPYHRRLDGLCYHELFSDTFRLYAGIDHPLARLPPARLTRQRVNTFAAVHAGIPSHPAIESLIADMRLAATAYDYDTRLSMLLSGQFIGFMPEAVAASYVERGLLRVLDVAGFRYALSVAAISRKTADANRVRELFWGLITRRFPVEPSG